MMKTRPGIERFTGIVAAVALALAACGGPAPDTGAGRGIVEDVDLASREVTLDHGDIPGLMKAMTMTFSVADPVDLEAVEPGTRVDFELKLQEGRYVVTKIHPAGP